MILTHSTPLKQMAASAATKRLLAKQTLKVPPPANRDRVLVHWAVLLFTVGNIPGYNKAQVNLSSRNNTVAAPHQTTEKNPAGCSKGQK